MEDRHEIRIYPSRVRALAGVLLSAGMIVLAVLLQFGYLHATSHTNPTWMYQEPDKTILALAFLFVFGPGFLFFGYWMCTMKPLIVIDDEGMSRRALGFARSYMPSQVSWRHVERIDAYDSGGRMNGDLLLTITLKERESEEIASEDRVDWSFQHWLLPMRSTKLIALIEKHCAVHMRGARQRRL